MSDPNPFSDVEQRVRDAWEARCGVRRGPLEQADVDAIAQAAFVLEGVKPTVEFIRRIAGGGSPNTIHPKLDAWFRQGREPGPAAAVPAELLAVWERLRADAARVAEDEFAPALAALADDRSALAAAQAQLATDQAALANERVTTERVVAALREEFRDLQARNQALEARNDTLQANVVQLQSEARDGADELRQTEEQLAWMKEARKDAVHVSNEAARRVATLQTEAEAREADLVATRKALQFAEAENVAMQAAASSTAAALTEAAQREGALTAELATVRAAAAEQAQRADELTHELQLAQITASAEATLREHLKADLSRERDALDVARARAGDAVTALAASQASLTEVTAERDRLHGRLDPLARHDRNASRAAKKS